MSAFRATRTLLNKLPESPDLYHYAEGRTPFWRKVRSLLSLNPEISSGLPLPLLNRYPQPASRPEKPATVPSKDVAQNLYHNRDFRRKYPQTDVITQQYLTELLLASPNEDGTKSLPVPGSEQSTSLTVPSDLASPTAFTQVLEQVQVAPENKYSATNMPPKFPSTKTHHLMKLQKDAIPHGKHDYFPVTLQRINLVSAFALSVISVVLAIIALTGFQIGQPSCTMKINKADMRMQQFVETKLDLDLDLNPLFNWNTKQVFLSLTASYESPRRVRVWIRTYMQGQNDVVIWDKIVRNKQDAVIRLRNLRNKYGMREYTKSFDNVTSVDYRVEWNVMPYVGIMQRGATERSEPFMLVHKKTSGGQTPKLMTY
ncbi:hypothetical protein MEQU1_000791 [Malassezia equina]|uniref:Uncharacterized protein n=1 Tax=Malassezia equina TaxID=1381935 RepID=A0AAF0EBM9_9BASI|nr:hypothetical protein MEQU1_000791 [Malassezia equina]